MTSSAAAGAFSCVFFYGDLAGAEEDLMGDKRYLMAELKMSIGIC